MAEMQRSSPTELLNQLLDHDLRSFAARLDLTGAPNPIDTKTAVRLLNLAEQLSRSTAEEDRNSCLLICGLLWEHRSTEWEALPQFVMNLLSRLGLAPSMRMVDPEYAGNGLRHLSWGSIAIEAMMEARNLQHEVTVGDGLATLTLSGFQHEVWCTMNEASRLGISAPTSAGKSYVLLYKALDILASESGTVLYVVPTISLIQQVTRDFHSAAQQLRIRDLDVLQTYTGQERAPRIVYVLTQERALSALSQADAFKKASLVIVDEIQNIERVADEDEERAHTLFDVLQEIVVARHPKRAVISGPRVENIAQLTREFFGSRAKAISQGLPPVVNVTYAFSGGAKTTFLKQYVPGVDGFREISVRYPPSVAKSLFGKRRYDGQVLDFLTGLTARLAEKEGTLLFSPTASQATKTALALAERGQWTMDEGKVEKLERYVAETVHERYALPTCLASGVAYHHGKMPLHVRVAVEQAFSSLVIRVLTCTTTLMQGMNLPAKNIVARNPDLFIQKRAGATSLTPYEFANLRGRAGRLLKDFVGRAIVLDETAFDQAELDFPGKSVEAGYGDRFAQHRDDILRSLRRGEPVSATKLQNDLVVYVRQAIMKYGEGALARLTKAGIAITDEEYAQAARHLQRLTVPREICARAPYWDPLVLEELYTADRRGALEKVPNSPFAGGFTQRLVSILLQLREISPFYYDKYFEEDKYGAVSSIARTAQRWATEVSLKEIISWGGAEEDVTWEQIDRRIARVNQQVAHDLPKLLKPLVAMQNPENPLLGFIEMGAYRKEVRRLIEMGVPRETAIRVRHRMADVEYETLSDAALIGSAQSASSRLNLWERMQLDSLVMA